jgi:hypothetical protein
VRALVALVTVVVLVLILWVTGAFSSASNNITCKKQQGQQYELCVQGQPHPVYVPYAVWQSARVGGYYDKGTRKVFSSVSDDPEAPHGFLREGGDGHVSVHVGGDK